MTAPFGLVPVKQEGMPLWGDPMGSDGYMTHENGVYSIHIFARRLSEQEHQRLVAAVAAEVSKILYGSHE